MKKLKTEMEQQKFFSAKHYFVFWKINFCFDTLFRFCLLIVTGHWLLITTVHALPGDSGRLLSYGSSGRDISLGGAVSSMPQGSNSLYWNPSLLSAVNQKDFSLLQAQLFGQTTLNWVGYAHPFKKRAGTLAFQIIQLKTKGGEKRDSLNELKGSFNHQEQVVGFGYGFHPTQNDKLAIGVGFNMLKRTLDTADNTLYGFNIGGNYMAFDKLRTGLVLQNLLRGKQGDTDDLLPMGLRIGNSYEILSGFFITADMDMSNFRTPSFNFGTEYGWRFLSLRAGRPSDGDFAFGLGLNWKWLRLDIALSSHRDLGTVQVFSIGSSFGKDRSLSRRSFAETHLSKAKELYEKGQWIEANDWIEKALKLDPINIIIYSRSDRLSGTLKVLSFSNKKRMALDEQKLFLGEDESARLIREGVKSHIEGNDSEGSLFLRQALAHRRDDKRLKDLVQYVEKQGNIVYKIDPNLTAEEIIADKMKKVEDNFNLGRHEEALKYCLEVVKLVPDMSLARVRLGSIYYAVGNMIRAQEEYGMALKLNPNDGPLKKFMKLQGWLKQ